MKRLAVIAALCVAATYAGSASAGVPAGFTTEPVISARAAFVSLKQVNVYCATTDAAWLAFLASINDTPPPGTTVFGVTPTPGGSEAYLAPETCAAIHTRIHKRAVNLPTLGAALYVLASESEHMRGDTDTGITACDALAVLPSFIFKRWGFRSGTSATSQVIAGAKNYHQRQPPPYHAGPCG